MIELRWWQRWRRILALLPLIEAHNPALAAGPLAPAERIQIRPQRQRIVGRPLAQPFARGEGPRIVKTEQRRIKPGPEPPRVRRILFSGLANPCDHGLAGRLSFLFGNRNQP